MKLHSNILEKVRLYEEKRGIIYAKTDGNLYKGIKVFYIIALIYTFGVNSMFLLGNILVKSIFDVLKNSVYTVAVLSLALVAAWVIMGFKKYLWAHIVSCVLNALSCVGLILTFGKLLADVIGFKAKFYYCHLVPLALAVILSVILTIIAVRAILKTQKTYKKIVENIYETYKATEENPLTDQEWEEVLKNI